MLEVGTHGTPFLALCAVVALSAYIQGAVGFGYALIAAPLFALLAPELVPGPIILSSVVLSVAAGVRERDSIDRRGVGLAMIGRVPGVALGATALALLPTPVMNVVFGALVLLGVGLSTSGLRLGLSTRTLLGTGFMSGLMGTMTSIGGPPMALLYQHEQGPRLRSTLNTYFALGSTLSIPALALAGRFGRAELIDGLMLIPATLVGFAFSGATHAYLDRGRTRRAVLVVASASALAVLVKALLG